MPRLDITKYWEKQTNFQAPIAEKLHFSPFGFGASASVPWGKRLNVDKKLKSIS